MEVGMSLNQLVVRLPLSSSNGRTHEDSIVRHSLFSSSSTKKAASQKPYQQLVVEAKGKKGMAARQYQRAPPPPLPKLEDDGNPKFVIFIRMSNVYLWYPLNIVTGGTTAKIMVAAKDNFLGKYIYKDTLARNLAAVIYRDEKEIQKLAIKQFRVLRSVKDFRYGYKLVENIRIALYVQKAALHFIDAVDRAERQKIPDEVKEVGFYVGPDELASLVHSHDLKRLESHGGAQGLAKKLSVSLVFMLEAGFY